MEFTIIENVFIWAVPVLFAITVHEASHALIANYYGDNTAKNLGRLSVNPIRHIDWVGTVIVPIVLLILSGFRITLGWAKPVPVNASNFKKPLAHMAVVSIAGPLANLIMAVLWAVLMKLILLSMDDPSRLVVVLVSMCKIGILINLFLALVNLIPIPPLDGSRILAYLLPKKYVSTYYKLEPYGIIILLLLLVTGMLGKFLVPLVIQSTQFIFSVLGIV
jgi:Zn-dependent protease